MLSYIEEFRCLDALWDLGYSGELNSESLYQLAICAGESKKMAARKQSLRAMARMRAGMEA